MKTTKEPELKTFLVFCNYSGNQVGSPKEVENREVRPSKLPSGANAYRFYSRIVAEVEHDDGTVKIQSDRMGISKIHFPSAELVTKSYVERLAALADNTISSYSKAILRDRRKEYTDDHPYILFDNDRHTIAYDESKHVVLGEDGQILTGASNPEEDENVIVVKAPKQEDVVSGNIITGVKGQGFTLSFHDGRPVVSVAELEETFRPQNHGGAQIRLDPEVFTEENPLRLAHSRVCEHRWYKAGSLDLCSYCSINKDLSVGREKVFFWPKPAMYVAPKSSLFHSAIYREMYDGGGSWTEDEGQATTREHKFRRGRFDGLFRQGNRPEAERLWNDPDGDTPIACDKPFHVQVKGLTFEVRWKSPEGKEHRWDLRWNSYSLTLRVLD